MAWLALENLAQSGVSGAADGKLGACSENHDVCIFAVGLDLSEAIQIHDVRAVNAQESLRVERFFQVGESLLLEVFLSLNRERHVIVLSFGEVEFSDGNDVHARSILYHNALEILRRRPRGGGQFGGRRQ